MSSRDGGLWFKRSGCRCHRLSHPDPSCRGGTSPSVDFEPHGDAARAAGQDGSPAASTGATAAAAATAPSRWLRVRTPAEAGAMSHRGCHDDDLAPPPPPPRIPVPARSASVALTRDDIPTPTHCNVVFSRHDTTVLSPRTTTPRTFLWRRGMCRVSTRCHVAATRLGRYLEAPRSLPEPR